MLKRYLKLSEFKLQWSIFAVLVALFTLFIMGAPRIFLAPDMYYSFMSTIPFMTIMALALTPVIICKEIDLSFPSVMGISAWMFASLSASTGNPTLALIISLITGLLAGLLNGILVVKVGIPSLIVTIGTMFFWKGLVLVFSAAGGITLVPLRGTILFQSLVGRIGGVIPAQALWAVGLAFLFWLILNRHKFGTHIYFTGDNIESARMMGIPVNKVKILVFTQLGFFAAFAGILLDLEMSYYWPTSGEGYLLETIAAVFLGGTSAFGGMGTIFGTFIGCIIIGSLESGIISVGLSGYWTNLIYGLVIVISVSIHSILRRRT
ncbi:sugar ABC transporter permease [Candidatus Aerophobetes bacterium Ae_b3a]|nr:MAG: sugar ABC transporter permease [Candidatus Aerophobetes bacterium Ae_b3a]